MNALKLRLLIFVLLIGTQIGRATDPLDTWTWRYPLPPRVSLLAVTYGNGQFVAVGNRGVILTSTDRVNWVQRFFNSEKPSPQVSPGYLSAITYHDGQFVAVGSSDDANLSITAA